MPLQLTHAAQQLPFDLLTSAPVAPPLSTDTSSAHAGVQDVAIKMVHHSDAEAREKFEGEIAMLKFVSRDRNIVQFYGAGVRISDPHAEGKPEPRLWLITEYMEVSKHCICT